MNDYFTALMRSAGAQPDAPTTRMAEPRPSQGVASAANEFDIEQPIDIESAAPDDRVPAPAALQPPLAPVEDAATHAHALEENDSPVAPRATVPPNRPDRQSSDAPRARLPIETAAAPQCHAGVNPVVRAALNWVRADPETLAQRTPTPAAPHVPVSNSTPNPRRLSVPGASQPTHSRDRPESLRDPPPGVDRTSTPAAP
jgi:hypothetical protein